MLTIEDIQQQVLLGEAMQIVGNNSQLKSKQTNTLAMAQYSGVIGYHPEELVMTVKAGTKISELSKILDHKDQALPFTVEECDNATIGGAYAIGSPALRDAVLGVKIIDGKGQILNFGGQVMKNVAGYDVTRLLVGSRGKLAVICEISFRVLPKAYIVKTNSPTTKINTANSIIKQGIEQGFKNIFDPLGVFV